jgi:hypothetical protein
VGVCGLRSDALDWPRLEFWCAELLRRAGTHYLLEQALVAMLAAESGAVFAPAADYITQPREEEIAEPLAVMHHYVHDSKRGYFRTAWRHVAPCDDS